MYSKHYQVYIKNLGKKQKHQSYINAKFQLKKYKCIEMHYILSCISEDEYFDYVKLHSSNENKSKCACIHIYISIHHTPTTYNHIFTNT